MDNSLIKIEGQSGITATGWDLSSATEDQWEEAGRILVKVDQAKQWWLGDWWNACKWGEGKEACEKLDINYESAQACGKVAIKIQNSRRLPNLSFSHHQAVAFIDCETTRRAMLDRVVEENASVKQLWEWGVNKGQPIS